MTVQIPFKRNDWIIHTEPWFRPFVFWLTYPNIWTSWLWDLQWRWCIFHFGMRMSGCCVCCLTWTSWKSGYNVLDSSGCHLGRWRSMFSEYCVRTRIIFYNVTSEYDPAFILWLLRFKLRILKMTNIHQWRKMNFSPLIPCLIDHFLLVSDFRQLPCRNFLQFFPILLPLLSLHSEFYCLRHRNEFENETVVSHRIHPFCSDTVLMRCMYSSLDPWSCALVGINNTSKSCLAFPNIAVGLHTIF